MPLSQNVRIALIGGGKMGEAIMGGWIASDSGIAKDVLPENFVVVECSEERRSYLLDRYGVACVAEASEIQGCVDVVLLAVKPQVMRDVVMNCVETSVFSGGSQGPLYISIAVGLTTSYLQDCLPRDARLVRTMPNVPLLVGAGATTISQGKHAQNEDTEFVYELFTCLGDAYLVDESLMDATAAISGSGPAYVAAMIEALRDAGITQGLDFELAEALALQTVYGTAALIKSSGQTPEETRISVCSPGGTTLAALKAMNEKGFTEVFDAGVAAAIRRSKELSA